MFHIKHKLDSNLIAKTCYSLKACKKWFEDWTDIPWVWEVHKPDGTVLDGRDYKSWK